MESKRGGDMATVDAMHWRITYNVSLVPVGNIKRRQNQAQKFSLV
jgi:hypothetical protein